MLSQPVSRRSSARRTPQGESPVAVCFLLPEELVHREPTSLMFPQADHRSQAQVELLPRKQLSVAEVARQASVAAAQELASQTLVNLVEEPEPETEFCNSDISLSCPPDVDLQSSTSSGILDNESKMALSVCLST